MYSFVECPIAGEKVTEFKILADPRFITSTYAYGRAVLIELFTARVLYRVSYRVLEYSMDTGSSY